MALNLFGRNTLVTRGSPAGSSVQTEEGIVNGVQGTWTQHRFNTAEEAQNAQRSIRNVNYARIQLRNSERRLEEDEETFIHRRGSFEFYEQLPQEARNLWYFLIDRFTPDHELPGSFPSHGSIHSQPPPLINAPNTYPRTVLPAEPPMFGLSRQPSAGAAGPSYQLPPPPNYIR